MYYLSGRRTQKISRVETLDMANKILHIATERDDDWGRQVIGRLEGSCDLVAEEASYHRLCMSEFFANRHCQYGQGSGRTEDEEKERAFNLFCEWLETEIEDQVFTIAELHTKMLEDFSDGEVYGKQYFQELLVGKTGRYKDDMFITNQERKLGVLCMKDKAKQILRDHKKAMEQEEEDTAIIKTAALLIRNKIRTIKIDPGYPKREEMANEYPNVPEVLRLFLSYFLTGDSLIDTWAQNIIKASRPRSGIMPAQLGLAVQLDHQFGSKWLIERMHRLKICESYTELQSYKWSVIRDIALKEIMGELIENPPILQSVTTGDRQVANVENNQEENDDQQSVSQSGTDLSLATLEEMSSCSQQDTNSSEEEPTAATEQSQSEAQPESLIELEDFGATAEASMGRKRVGEQFVGDNLDIQMSSPYGLRSIHAMGRIKITPQSSHLVTDMEVDRAKVSPVEKQDLLKKLEIRIMPYYPKRSNGFTTIDFIPIDSLMEKFDTSLMPCTGDTAWILGWLVKQKLIPPSFSHPSWKGFMKGIHGEAGMEKSVIDFLPIINAPPDNFSTVYTTIMECLRLSRDLPTMITFDLPLWQKATRIILEKNLPVIARLGGFHQLMSFTSAIGYLMTGSGIEECMQIVFPGFPVDKLLSGKSHQKTLHALFLIDAALCSYLLEDLLSNEELEQMNDEIDRMKEGRYGATYSDSTFLCSVAKRVEERLAATKLLGRTQRLWVEFHENVQIVRDFVRAERVSDIQLHMNASAKMLPVMMAAGHAQYAKAIRLTLQQFLKFDGQTKAFFVTDKNHTVRYSTHEWSAIWADLSIEQTLMRWAKSRGGLVGGRLRTPSSQKQWLLTLTSFTFIHQLFEEKHKNQGIIPEHLDLTKKRMDKDFDTVQKLVGWFKTSDLIKTDPTNLVSFSTGEICLDETVNSEKSSTIGMSMLKSLDGGNFSSTVKLKDKCTNFNALRKKIKVHQKDVVLEPYILFSRLSVASERNLTLKDSLAYELTIQPASLFDQNHFMRPSNKHKLGTYLKSKTEELDACSAEQLVIDGGWLLHQIGWQDGQTFAEICAQYVSFIKRKAAGRQCTVVFDGYASSPKDHEHTKRKKKDVGGIQLMISSDRICSLSKEKFLANDANKSNFIAFLSQLISADADLKVITANDDCDTLIVKEAVTCSATSSVEVIAEDTDILVLLLYHGASADCVKELFLSTSKATFNIKEISANLTENERDRLLFIHSFTGCDTVSGIYWQSKKALLKKLCSQPTRKVKDKIDAIFAKIMALDTSKEQIVEAGISLFSYIYGDITKPLRTLRLNKYETMAATKMVKPEYLPPTEGAVRQHTLRAFLQYHDWILLGSMTLSPCDYGWKIKDGKYTPILTEEEVAPPELLKLTICNCKKGCKTSRCSCKSMGLKCIPACGECHGQGCEKSDEPSDDAEEGSDEEN